MGFDSTESRVWITGAGGLIGHALVQRAPADLDVTALTRATLDLADFQAVRARFEQDRPDLIIHCAALSRSPDCEARPEMARKLNVEVTALLAELAVNGRLVFFSTDLVFDGRKGSYVESDSVCPLSIYGETKVEAERAVLSYGAHLVIRTSLNGGTSPTGDRGFNEQMRKAWGAGHSLRLFTDEFRSPIGAEATADAVWSLALKSVPGVYHVAGGQRLSRWQIGQLLAARWPELQPKMTPGSLKEYHGPPRAPDTSLDCGKTEAAIGSRLPKFSEWLASQPAESF